MIDQRYVKHVSFKYFYITTLSFHLNVKKKPKQNSYLCSTMRRAFCESFTVSTLIIKDSAPWPEFSRMRLTSFMLASISSSCSKKKIVGFQNLRKDSNSFSPETFLQYILIKKLHFLKYTCIFLKNCTGIPTVYKHIQNRFPCIFDAIFFK